VGRWGFNRNQSVPRIDSVSWITTVGNTAPEPGAKIEALREERRRGPLRQCVKCSLNIYLSELDGFTPAPLYDLVLSEVERALFEVALARTRGNLTKTAELLGVNRGTLRKRLKKYGLVSDTPWRPSNARS
jgi:Fis family transcriptional regulator